MTVVKGKRGRNLQAEAIIADMVKTGLLVEEKFPSLPSPMYRITDRGRLVAQDFARKQA